MDEPSDAKLVRRVRDRGDTGAYGQLVERYQGHAYGLAYSLLGDWAEAQDMAQEAFVRAYVNLHVLDDPGRFAGWLRRIVFGTCMDWLRSYRPDAYRSMGGPADVDQLQATADPDVVAPPDAAIGRELSRVVLAAIAELPPKYRIPLTMFHLDGLSYEKVAEFLDLPLGTVKSLLHRAREKLKPVLAGYAARETTSMVKEVFDEHKLPPDFARNVLDGVPTLGWGRGKECTFAGALEAALAVTEHPYSYTDIMGFSALAFRVRWYQADDGPGWCGSSPVGEFPEEIAAATRATGWQIRIENSSDNPDMERFAPDIVKSVDAGRPVLVYPPDLNMAVAYGYEDGGKTLLLRDYMKGDEPASLPTAKLGFLLLFPCDRVEPVPRRIAVTESLRMAVKSWRQGYADAPKGKYWHGDAALGAWADDIVRSADLADLADDLRGSLFFVSWWNYDALVDARQAAVAYLRASAEVFEGDARTALERAAAIYDEEAEMLRSIFHKKDAFLGLCEGKGIEDWTNAVRERERQILADARAKESAAIAEIEGALEDEQ